MLYIFYVVGGGPKWTYPANRIWWHIANCDPELRSCTKSNRDRGNYGPVYSNAYNTLNCFNENIRKT